MSDLTVVCELLDDAALRNLGLINDYLTLSNELEGRVRSGWLHLAETRKVVGYASASAAQLDRREQAASLLVTVRQSSADRSRAAQFQLVAEPISSRCLPFGLLSPAASKASREDFRRAAELACQLATIRAELLLLDQNYKQLLSRKSQLLSQTPSE